MIPLNPIINEREKVKNMIMMEFHYYTRAVLTMEREMVKVNYIKMETVFMMENGLGEYRN